MSTKYPTQDLTRARATTPSDLSDPEQYLRSSPRRAERLRTYLTGLTGTTAVNIQLTRKHDTASIGPNPTGEGVVLFVTTNPLPQPVTSFERDVYDSAVQHALVLHEAGHDLFTDFETYFATLDEVRENRPKPIQDFAKSFFNLWEDLAVEEGVRNVFSEVAAARLELLNQNLGQVQVHGVPEDVKRSLNVVDAVELVITDIVYLKSGVAAKISDPDNDEWGLRNDQHQELYETVLPTIQACHVDVLLTTDGTERAELIKSHYQAVSEVLFGSEQPEQEQSQNGSQQGDGSDDSQENGCGDGAGGGSQSSNGSGPSDGEGEQQSDPLPEEDWQPETESGSSVSADITDEGRAHLSGGSSDSQESETDTTQAEVDELQEAIFGDKPETHDPPETSESEEPESPEDGAGNSEFQSDPPKHDTQDEGDNTSAPQTSLSDFPTPETDSTSQPSDSKRGENDGGSGPSTEDVESQQSDSFSEGSGDDGHSDDTGSETAEEEPSIEEQLEDAMERERRRVKGERTEFDEKVEQFNDAKQTHDADVENTGSIRSADLMPSPSGGFDAERYATAARDANRLTEPLQQRLIKSRMDERIGGVYAGQVSPSHLHMTATGDPRMMERTLPGNNKEYAFILILDRSGSMSVLTSGSENPIEAAEEATVQLALALEACGVEVSIIDFYKEEVRSLSPFGVPTEDCAQSIVNGDASGRTPLGAALDFAVTQAEGNQKESHIIALTDDDPSDIDRYESVLRECPHLVHGVLMNIAPHIEVDEAEARRLYDTTISVNSKNELSRALFALARELTLE